MVDVSIGQGGLYVIFFYLYYFERHCKFTEFVLSPRLLEGLNRRKVLLFGGLSACGLGFNSEALAGTPSHGSIYTRHSVVFDMLSKIPTLGVGDGLVFRSIDIFRSTRHIRANVAEV